MVQLNSEFKITAGKHRSASLVTEHLGVPSMTFQIWVAENAAAPIRISPHTQL